MAIGFGSRRISKMSPKLTSLSAVRDALFPALHSLCHRYNVAQAELFCDYVSDCIQLVVTDEKGKRFTHPRFITRQEIMDRDWLDFVEERFASTVEGRPTNKVVPAMPDTTFSLYEIELAQDIVDSLK